MSSMISSRLKALAVNPQQTLNIQLNNLKLFNSQVENAIPYSWEVLTYLMESLKARWRREVVIKCDVLTAPSASSDFLITSVGTSKLLITFL
jgi:hypothetical protein